MIKNRKLRFSLYILEIFLLLFQAITLILTIKDYYLIYDFIFYVVNYLILIIFCLLIKKGKILRYIFYGIAIALITANTVFFYFMGNVNLIVSKSENNKYEVILKEYKHMNFNTIRLKRRWLIYGKKVETFKGSYNLKFIEENNYKIIWDNDQALILYKNYDAGVEVSIVSFRKDNYISYQNVTPALEGKWIDKSNKNNNIIFNQGKIIYTKDDKLYYYNSQNTVQYGVDAILVKGGYDKPTFAVLLNSNAKIGENCLLNDDATISIYNIGLEDNKGSVYYKE
ncbi:MAG: hypothetical protein KIB43_03395 [Clostridium baratii]|uniref:hypothetical protein n=1 Tax=Clostridium baratii TaxID=1561 RepID=UPI00243255F1|nr:hypothetical protein [Clostridium baratii]MBS6005981.1 hypothetical protein [Clostridium baratii]